MSKNNNNQKTVLITGAAKRIGAGIAKNMAKNGYNVALHYNNSEQEAKALAEEISTNYGVKTALIKADLSNPEQVANIINLANAELGTIDCLILNAALFEKDNIDDMSYQSLSDHLNVNLISSIMLTQEFAKQASGDSNIIYLLDGMKNWSISPIFLSYSISKLSLQHNIPLLAKSLSPKTRVNGIALGATKEGLQDKESTFDKIREITPLKRTSDEQEVLSTINYILSAKSLTGQTLDLSAGMNL